MTVFWSLSVIANPSPGHALFDITIVWGIAYSAGVNGILSVQAGIVNAILNTNL
jgi:hypothetical protein